MNIFSLSFHCHHCHCHKLFLYFQKVSDIVIHYPINSPYQFDKAKASISELSIRIPLFCVIWNFITSTLVLFRRNCYHGKRFYYIHQQADVLYVFTCSILTSQSQTLLLFLLVAGEQRRWEQALSNLPTMLKRISWCVSLPWCCKML